MEQILINKHMSMLGLKAYDMVTGMKGAITSIKFDLYGCIQVAIDPPVKKGNEENKGRYWYDVSRVKITGKKPVMKRPNYRYGRQAQGKQGCATGIKSF